LIKKALECLRFKLTKTIISATVNKTLKTNLKMTNNKVYSLCEAVADISYIAASENYRTEDSRKMIFQFIEWATEFEHLHRNVEWGITPILDYIDSINHFTIFKIKQWSDK
jgi:hypothetical protein